MDTIELKRKADTEFILRHDKTLPKPTTKVYIPISKSYGFIQAYQYNDNGMPFVLVYWMFSDINNTRSISSQLFYALPILKSALKSKTWILLEEN